VSQTVVKNRTPGKESASTVDKQKGHHVTSTDITDNLKEAVELNADKRVAIYIAVLAVFLAICTMGGDNSTKDATRTNILASDTWSFYQAKKLRETNYRLLVDTMELRLATESALSEEARKKIQDKANEYRAEADRMKSDPRKGEGQQELAAKAKIYEGEREVALRRDPYFDYATAFLQIAIVLASASILFGGGLLLGCSFVVGGIGVAMMINGFTLLVNVPFIG
jgi:hypothetical protein